MSEHKVAVKVVSSSNKVDKRVMDLFKFSQTNSRARRIDDEESKGRGQESF